MLRCLPGRFYSIIMCLISLTNFIYAAHYYVDASLGSDFNNGLSANSAWKTINQINNFSFSIGDTVSFKCGQRFAGFTLIPNIGRLTFNNYGTGAKPIIDGQGLRNCVDINNKNNIKFENLKFVYGFPRDVNLNRNNYITFYNCNIDSCSGTNIFHQNIYSGQGTFLVIKNSTLSYAGVSTGGGHGIYIDGTKNTLLEFDTLLSNTNDNIRIGYGYENPYYTDSLTIRYCVAKYAGDENISDDGSRYSKFYYNVFENELSTWSVNISLYSSNGYSPSSNQYFNNTIIIHDPDNTDNAGFFVYTSPDVTNMTVFNNIFYLSDTEKGWAWYGQNSPLGKWTINHNLYYAIGNKQTHIWHWNNSTQSSFSNWQTIGFDTNGIYGNPLFSNFSAGDYTILKGSPAINLGMNNNIATDGRGNSIPSNKPDAGAFQHPFLQGFIKVFLSGPFNNGNMTTYLDQLNLIPISQPYKTAPWNYAGSENVNSIPANIVDWILIELRTNPQKSSMIAQRAAFLNSNGSIVDTDGFSPVRFDFISNGSYYIVLKHRNHLAIMSAQAASSINSSLTYDFTTSQNQAYGINPMAFLGNNIYGMYSGDGNANGGISSVDCNNVWQLENGSKGYLPGDYDLNGEVNSLDRNLIWKRWNGSLTQVPQ